MDTEKTFAEVMAERNQKRVEVALDVLKLTEPEDPKIAVLDGFGYLRIGMAGDLQEVRNAFGEEAILPHAFRLRDDSYTTVKDVEAITPRDYYDHGWKLDVVGDLQAQLKTALAQPRAVCGVCALGAMLVADVLKNNEFTVEIAAGGIDQHEVRERLERIFDRWETAYIEDCFELNENPNTARSTRRFLGSMEPNDRLRYLMQNIVDHNGELDTEAVFEAGKLAFPDVDHTRDDDNECIYCGGAHANDDCDEHDEDDEDDEDEAPVSSDEEDEGVVETKEEEG